MTFATDRSKAALPTFPRLYVCIMVVYVFTLHFRMSNIPSYEVCVFVGCCPLSTLYVLYVLLFGHFEVHLVGLVGMNRIVPIGHICLISNIQEKVTIECKCIFYMVIFGRFARRPRFMSVLASHSTCFSTVGKGKDLFSQGCPSRVNPVECRDISQVQV